MESSRRCPHLCLLHQLHPPLWLRPLLPPRPPQPPQEPPPPPAPSPRQESLNARLVCFWSRIHFNPRRLVLMIKRDPSPPRLPRPRPCAARKMLPKRKLDQSGSGSDSQKEKSEDKEQQGQESKRPRVEVVDDSPGTTLTTVCRCRVQCLSQTSGNVDIVFENFVEYL